MRRDSYWTEDSSGFESRNKFTMTHSFGLLKDKTQKQGLCEWHQGCVLETPLADCQQVCVCVCVSVSVWPDSMFNDKTSTNYPSQWLVFMHVPTWLTHLVIPGRLRDVFIVGLQMYSLFAFAVCHHQHQTSYFSFDKWNIPFCSCSDLTLPLLSYCCFSSYTYCQGFDQWDLSIWRSWNAERGVADWISFFSEHCASNDMQLGPRRGEIWQKWGSKRRPTKRHAAIIKRVTRANGFWCIISKRSPVLVKDCSGAVAVSLYNL